MAFKLLKNISIFLLIIVMILMIYLGVYLPYQKASLYIKAYRAAATVRSFPEFQKVFDEVLNFYSPVGQAEVVKFLSNEILNMVQSKDMPKEIAMLLAGYVEREFWKLRNGRPYPGSNQQLAILGDLRHFIGVEYNDIDSLKMAERYYIQILDLSPRRPQALFGLYNLYDNVGDKKAAAEILKEIFYYWPQFTGMNQPK